MMRLNHFMARCGVASRRRCDDMIAAGRVKVNGETVTAMGVRIDEDNDVVELDDRRLSLKKQFTYIVLNKPLETVSSVRDTHRRRTVVDLLAIPQRVYPVGRLDQNSTGVLLLTDDGDLTHRLIHPKYKSPKVYHVWLDKRIKPIHQHHLQKGIKLDGAQTAPCQIKELRVINNGSLLEVTLHEGKKRQIRRMFAVFGYEVLELDRVSFAGITYAGLKRGEWRYLTEEEVQMLRGKVDLA
ncbi:MAG: rRNA pseudouridine synthase [Calditrichaeota bacterium]|nr:MAG: rRNA pseudouridine synthase [Calditrichota bacterium]